MAVPHFTSSFKSLKSNHSMLKRSKRGAFYIHKMNRFISVSSPKPQMTALSAEQAVHLEQKIREYSRKEYLNIFKTAVFTLFITAGLIMLFGELWKWIS